MAQHLVLLSEDVEPRPPCKAAPLMLKMSEPGRGHDQRRSISARRVGKPRTICCRAETDALVHGGWAQVEPDWTIPPKLWPCTLTVGLAVQPHDKNFSAGQVGERRLLADIVVKVENRTTLKISQKSIFSLLRCCVAFQRHYGGP
jgi:hypothetical protein